MPFYFAQLSGERRKSDDLKRVCVAKEKIRRALAILKVVDVLRWFKGKGDILRIDCSFDWSVCIFRQELENERRNI